MATGRDSRRGAARLDAPAFDGQTSGLSRTKDDDENEDDCSIAELG
jgi:hypothetical protein